MWRHIKRVSFREPVAGPSSRCLEVAMPRHPTVFCFLYRSSGYALLEALFT